MAAVSAARHGRSNYLFDLTGDLPPNQSTMDGETPQLNALGKKEMRALYRKTNDRVLKLPASTSAKYQALDVSPCLLTMHAYTKALEAKQKRSMADDGLFFDASPGPITNMVEQDFTDGLNRCYKGGILSILPKKQ